ncbi:alpha/beta-hydrolase [Penicillium verhagenii]|nr:alpha/beta-hydrolase [Penicillium verhagenii]
MAPTVLFVPGFWEGPTVFEKVTSLLTASGISTEVAKLQSTGTTSPGNPSMKDDVKGIRAHIEAILARGEDVLLALHSAGGFLGSEAMQGLDKKTRGDQSGVVSIVFLAAAVFPEGYQHQPLPFAVVEGGASYCAQPEILLLGDLPEYEKAGWLDAIKPQPAQGWDDTVSYAGWKDVPSVYLICEEDNALPVPLQEQLAALAGSKIERCSAGHLPMLSQPEAVAGVVQSALA